MSKKILILGGRPIELKHKEILETYKNICRINLNIKFKNPESKDIFYVNNHVKYNIVDKRTNPKKLKSTCYKFVDIKEKKKFYNLLDKKEYSKIIEDSKNQAKKIIMNGKIKLENDLDKKRKKFEEEIEEEIINVEKQIKKFQRSSVDNINKIYSQNISSNVNL